MILADEFVDLNRLDPERQARPILSTLDTYDHLTQIEYPFRGTPVQGRRPGWNVPSISIANEPIATIRSSTNLRFVSPTIPTPAGMYPDPVVNPTSRQSFAVVPNMAQSILADSNVQISFFITVSTPAAADFVQFAIFRDGSKLSQVFPLATAAPGTPNSVSGSYTDNPVIGRHVYDLRWTPGVSQAKAFGKNRTFQVQNLRAQ